MLFTLECYLVFGYSYLVFGYSYLVFGYRFLSIFVFSVVKYSNGICDLTFNVFGETFANIFRYHEKMRSNVSNVTDKKRRYTFLIDWK